eukprot:scaffold245673_cov32-Tisochrysis_lutea.AAC.3
MMGVMPSSLPQAHKQRVERWTSTIGWRGQYQIRRSSRAHLLPFENVSCGHEKRCVVIDVDDLCEPGWKEW